MKSAQSIYIVLNAKELMFCNVIEKKTYLKKHLKNHKQTVN